MDDEYLVSSIDEIQAPRHGLYQFTQSIVTSVRGQDIFRADDSQMEARYQRLIESLFDAIQQMFAYFQIQGQDQLSLTIEGRLEDEQEIQIGIPLARWIQACSKSERQNANQGIRYLPDVGAAPFVGVRREFHAAGGR